MKAAARFLLHLYPARLSRDLSLPPIQIWMQLLGAICFFYLHLLAFSLLISKFSFPGWTTAQMWALLYSFEIYSYLAFFIFWKGFLHTVRDINTGGFDALLVKPMNIQLVTFFRAGGLHNLLAASLGLLYLIIHVLASGLPVTLWSILLYVLTMITSLWFLYSFTLLFIPLNFRYGHLPITGEIAFHFQDFIKYPGDIFPSTSILLTIFIIPFSLLVSFPVSLLLLKTPPVSSVIIYFSALFLVTLLSQLTWRAGLSRYSSASS